MDFHRDFFFRWCEPRKAYNPLVKRTFLIFTTHKNFEIMNTEKSCKINKNNPQEAVLHRPLRMTLNRQSTNSTRGKNTIIALVHSPTFIGVTMACGIVSISSWSSWRRPALTTTTTHNISVYSPRAHLKFGYVRFGDPLEGTTLRTTSVRRRATEKIYSTNIGTDSSLLRSLSLCTLLLGLSFCYD